MSRFLASGLRSGMWVTDSRRLGRRVNRSPSDSASQPITESPNTSTLELRNTWPFDGELFAPRQTTKREDHPLLAAPTAYSTYSHLPSKSGGQTRELVCLEVTAAQHVTDHGQRRRLQDQACCDGQCSVITWHITSWFPAQAEQTGSAAFPSVPPARFMPPRLWT